MKLPPQKELLLPQLQELFAHPQFVAVKSLIIKPPCFVLWFIVCMVACQCFLYQIIFFLENLTKLTLYVEKYLH